MISLCHSSVFASSASEWVLLQLAWHFISKLHLPHFDTIDAEGDRRINNKEISKTVSDALDLNTNFVCTGQ
jgi:hypothetical protein